MPTIADSQQWQDCLHYMRRRLKQQSYNTWLKPTRGEPNGNGDCAYYWNTNGWDDMPCTTYYGFICESN